MFKTKTKTKRGEGARTLIPRLMDNPCISTQRPWVQLGSPPRRLRQDANVRALVAHPAALHGPGDQARVAV